MCALKRRWSSEFDHRLAAATFEIACELTNPLVGRCQRRVRPKKGADPRTVCEFNGKTPFGVARAAQRHGIAVVALAGPTGDGGEEVLYAHGFTALVPIGQGVGDLATALADGPGNLKRAVTTNCRLLTLNRRLVDWWHTRTDQ
jgi:glycerate kinase